MVPSQIHFHCTRTGTPTNLTFDLHYLLLIRWWQCSFDSGYIVCMCFNVVQNEVIKQTSVQLYYWDHKPFFSKAIIIWRSFFFFLFFFAFLGPQPWHMEVSRLGVKLELQLLAYTTAKATWRLSHLQPTPQLMATPDPWPTERGQWWNPCPHGH